MALRTWGPSGASGLHQKHIEGRSGNGGQRGEERFLGAGEEVVQVSQASWSQGAGRRETPELGWAMGEKIPQRAEAERLRAWYPAYCWESRNWPRSELNSHQWECKRQKERRWRQNQKNTLALGPMWAPGQGLGVFLGTAVGPETRTEPGRGLTWVLSNRAHLHETRRAWRCTPPCLGAEEGVTNDHQNGELEAAFCRVKNIVVERETVRKWHLKGKKVCARPESGQTARVLAQMRTALRVTSPCLPQTHRTWSGCRSSSQDKGQGGGARTLRWRKGREGSTTTPDRLQASNLKAHPSLGEWGWRERKGDLTANSVQSF